MPPKTKTSNVDPEILKAIQVTMQPVLDAQSSIQASQDAMLKKMDKAMLELASVSKKVDTLEAAVAASSSRVDTVVTSALPAITSHMSTISTALAMRQLDLEVHRRKWALVISGLDGPAKEPEQDTRAACLKLAADILQVQNAAGTRISACHRLSPSAGAGIIIRFTDLSERNEWLANAKHLKGKNISISPALPPILRQLKTDILNQRKTLDLNTRKNTRIQYLKQWPYVKLAIKEQDDVYPTISQKAIVKELLGVSPNLDFPEGL